MQESTTRTFEHLVFNVNRSIPTLDTHTELGDSLAGPFSAVSSAFIIDVQSNLLQPDPNEMTAAYMRILIRATLLPDADPSSVAWTGPPGIVTVQSLPYESLASFFAMLGKQ
jgi:hypothetical protein